MNDSELDRLLHSWKAPETPADSFRKGVWSRISRIDEARPVWSRWINSLLRPRVALAGVVASLLIGTGGGVAHAISKQKGEADTLAETTAAYVQSINPLDPMHLEDGK
jgi:hypothetical protein